MYRTDNRGIIIPTTEPGQLTIESSTEQPCTSVYPTDDSRVPTMDETIELSIQILFENCHDNGDSYSITETYGKCITQILILDSERIDEWCFTMMCPYNPPAAVCEKFFYRKSRSDIQVLRVFFKQFYIGLVRWRGHFLMFLTTEKTGRMYGNIYGFIVFDFIFLFFA